MKTTTKITYTQNSQDNQELSTSIKYETYSTEGDNVFSTSYVNTVENQQRKESFNKLLKNKNNIYEQIGNSYNENNWQIKEFVNNDLKKEYDDNYQNHTFNMDKCNIKGIDKKFLLNK